MTSKEKPPPLGWTLALILVILYFGLKVQAWWYEFQSQVLGDQIIQMRPGLSAIIQSRQIKAAGKAYQEVFEQVRAAELDGTSFLQKISFEVPPSVIVLNLELRQLGEFAIEGVVMAGVRSPEEALLPWANRLQGKNFRVKIRKLFPDSQMQGLWRFELKSYQVAND